MDMKTKIDELLKEELSENAFKIWAGINSKIPYIWDKASSSSGKYHKKEVGEVQSISEHTLEMLIIAKKMLRIFCDITKSGYTDSVMLSIALHDILKYGEEGTKKHTIRDHDKLIADNILGNCNLFLKIMSQKEFDILVECLRFHSGKWSTDANKDTFKFSDICPEALFVHMLDMLSSNDCLKV